LKFDYQFVMFFYQAGEHDPPTGQDLIIPQVKEGVMTSKQGIVLVVDDVKVNRHILARLLKQEGYSVVIAKGGRQALDMMKKQAFDLVLLSILMSEMDGYQVLGHLKADPLLCDIPVIVLAAVDELDSAVRCIELGAADYLIKPFNKVLLKARVDARLERKLLYDQEIQQQNEFLNSLLESLPHPFYVIDANDYTIKLANSAAGPGKLAEGLTCYELIHRSDKPCSSHELLCPLEEVRNTKKPVVVEHVHYETNGDVQIVEIHGYPTLGCDGEVSEQVQMKEQLKAVYELGQELIMLHDEDVITRRVIETTASVIQSGFVTLGLVDHSTN
jgi:CheY-like chemotaxis protein